MGRCYILLIAVALAACSGGDRAEDSRTVFRYNESKGITSLDPAQARTMGNIWAVSQIFNGLVRLDAEMRPAPSIAKSWQVLDGGTVYRFSLRDDAYFHDHHLFENGQGRAVVAGDFVYAFNRILDEKTLSPGRWVLRNVDTYREGGFRADGDSVLFIYLKKPFPPFLSMLSMPYCAVVPHEVVTALGPDFGRSPIGTGPFRFSEWHENVKLVLHRNPHYFEKDEKGVQLPYLDAVGITFITDAQSVFLEFLQGKLDLLSGLEDGSFKDAILTPNGTLRPDMKDKVVMQTMPFLNTEYLGFLMDTSLPVMKNSPLRLKAVRQAINYGFDRRRMMRYIRNNIGTPGEHGFLPDGLPGMGTQRTVGYSYDPVRARVLLVEAGFPNGSGLPEIVLHTTSQYVDLCEFMQHQLSEIGMKLRIEVNPGATHGALVSNSQIPFFRKSWIADYADAENFLSLFITPNHTPQGPNYTLFSNSEYDRLYETALNETDDNLRSDIHSKMDSLLMDEAPVVVLFYDRVLRFTRPGISGLPADAMNLLDLRMVRKEVTE
ncbi:MAG: ABC transporter substrate-binding protein [Flavobacteriales bacterium]|nr:ABC transporter substrate-binding protein [Flavobacteriales bacterium]